jgi:multiple sugar transport system substrate-binding protein
MAMYKQYAATYHKLNPNVTVDVRVVPFANLLSTIRTQANSSAGPTIANIYDLWLGQLTQGGIAAAAPASVTTDVKKNWGASSAAGVTNEGKVRGYPNEVDLYALNYNKALFRKAGLSGPPKTWTQLLSDSAKLKAAGVAQPFGVITEWDSGVVHPWLSLVDSDGGALLKNGKPNLTGRAEEETTKLYTTLVKDHYTVPSMTTANAETTGPYMDNFTSGKTAMIIMANWWESDLKAGFGSKFNSEVGTAPIPVGPHGKTSSAVSYGWSNIVNAHASSAEQKAAWAFLTWLDSPASGKKGASAEGTILTSLGILPSRQSDLKAFASKLKTPFLKTYVSELKTATPFPSVVPGAQLTDVMQQQLEAVIEGQSSASAALSSAQSQAQSLLSAAS